MSFGIGFGPMRAARRRTSTAPAVPSVHTPASTAPGLPAQPTRTSS
jgi:hypothetical protein